VPRVRVVIVETERLILRRLHADDAPFILTLVNDPGWLRYIGDKNVHSLDDARRYLEEGPLDMYRRLGFGLYGIELKQDGSLVGLCGLLKRDMLDDVDLGFALLPEHRGWGYAAEAAAAVLAQARAAHGTKRVLAIATPDNRDSARLLERLGFAFERTFETPDNSGRLQLYGIDLESGAGAR